MHLQALEVCLRVQFKVMYAVMLVFSMYLQALEVGLGMHFNEMSAVILVCIFKLWRLVGGCILTRCLQ